MGAMQDQLWKRVLGLAYIVAVAAIWIAASYIVKSVVGAGVSPFLVTYICNSLFIIYIPLVEVSRWWEDWIEQYQLQASSQDDLGIQRTEDVETVALLEQGNVGGSVLDGGHLDEQVQGTECKKVSTLEPESELNESKWVAFNSDTSSSAGLGTVTGEREVFGELDAKGRWTHSRVARVSLLICPFWFFAQLTFNLSLKYTTVTSNTILSSSSGLFTFLTSLVLLNEKFTCLKLLSVLFCMGGTIIVSLGDSKTRVSTIGSNPVLGDVLSLLSAGLYAFYVTLIRKKMPDEESGEGQASTAQFLGFVGLFNLLLFLPLALIIHFMRLESSHMLSWKQFGLIVGKGLLDNVLSDYLWAEAVLLTSPTATTVGLSIQVPLAAIVDTLTGHAPKLLDYLGGALVMVGFVGISIPSDYFVSRIADQEQDTGSIAMVENNTTQPVSSVANEIS